MPKLKRGLRRREQKNGWPKYNLRDPKLNCNIKKCCCNNEKRKTRKFRVGAKMAEKGKKY